MIINDLHIFGPFFPVENWALGQVLFFPVATAFVFSSGPGLVAHLCSPVQRRVVGGARFRAFNK